MALFGNMTGTMQVQTDKAYIAPAQALGSENAKLADTSSLAAFIRRRYEEMRRHRTAIGLDTRLMDALRSYNGKYSAKKLAEIRQFGGSEVYSRIGAVKCRGATSVLTDVYLSFDRTWGVEPTPVPTLPDEIEGSIDALISMEALAMVQRGVPPDPQAVAARRESLLKTAMDTANRKALEEAQEAEDSLYDKMIEGGWPQALREFLRRLPIYPFACIKGPVVQQQNKVRWETTMDGKVAVIKREPQMRWYAPDPTNLFFSPGADCIEKSSVVERLRVRRADLNALIGLPGYDEKAIRSALDEYERGYIEFNEGIDSTIAYEQNKENPILNESEFIDSLEFTGPVKGRVLREFGFTSAQIPDETLDYHVIAWMVGRHVIKAQFNPDPNQRPPYFVLSYEMIPGALIGHSLQEIIDDVVSVANAALRSLVNNMGFASGPQVAVNVSRLHPSTNKDSIFPWKRWFYISDPLAMSSSEKPIDFFQPQSNASELLGIYKEMTNIADETSSIPRFVTGSERAGGAASTAAGLSMLMNNASRVLQMIAGNIDENVIAPAVRMLYSLCLLTDFTNKFRGDENIVVRGVTLAKQREAERMRKLEFLQLTTNPVDLQIVGTKGRAAILRHLANDLGMQGEQIVPSEDMVAAQMQMQQSQAQQVDAQGKALPEGAGRIGEGTDNQQRTRDMVTAPRGRPAGT